jgi:TonB-linked SusC/RagA family outer membrane protein
VLLFALLAAAFPLAAQDLQPAAAPERIGGTVTGQGDQPLADVRVTVVGTRFGAVTGSDGRYIILGLTPGTYQVRAQRIGYSPSTRTVVLAAGTPAAADFALEVAATTLGDVVVVGYTRQERRTISDAVASVRAEDIQTQASATIEEKLRGRVPGVNVVASGEPGRPAQVIVRGQAFFGNPTPLYIVDGLYTRENPNLNPEDIESIEVLKDASAAAQYGAQAANGVVVITTRRGRPGVARIGINSYVGYQEVPKMLDLADAAEWRRIATMGYTNAGLAVPSGVTSSSANTDWQDAVFQRGAIQNLDGTITGGNESASFLVTGGYLRQVGTIIRTGFDRYSLRINSEGRSGRIRIGENVAFSRANNEGLRGFPLIDIARMPPTIRIFDTRSPSGYGFGADSNPTFGTNPVGLQRISDANGVSSQLFGNVFAEVGFLRYLSYRFNLGLNYEDWSGRNFRRMAQLRQNTVPDSSELTETRDNTTQLLYENQLSFNNQFGPHTVNAVAVMTEQVGDFDRVTATRRGFENPDYATINSGTLRIQNSGFRTENAIRSILARANYTFADRYIVTGSVRRDGSSRFGTGNKYGTFGAGSLGWVVSEEGFYGSIPFLSDHADYLKLRASYGELGNQDIRDYEFAAAITPNLGYPFGGVVQGGATQLAFANPFIKWQQNDQTNVGLDLNILRSTLSLSLDYYVANSRDALYQPPLPPSSGSSADPFVNAGSVRNRGFEMGLTHRWDRGRSGLNTTLTLQTVSNRVTSLSGDREGISAGPHGGITRTRVGAPIGTYYVRRFAGIFQSAAEVTAHCAQPTAQPGDVRYADLNRDCQINDQDRYEAGSANPDLTGGLFLDGRMGGFDASVGVRGSFGGKIYNGVRFWTDRMEAGSNYRSGFAPWTPSNRSTSTPRAVFGPLGAENARADVDRWLESGTFVRIQNLQVGYTLPERLNVGGFGFQTQRARVYVGVQNVYTFTDYTGWDPEVLGAGDPLARGVDDGFIYPNVRTFTLGLSVRP